MEWSRTLDARQFAVMLTDRTAICHTCFQRIDRFLSVALTWGERLVVEDQLKPILEYVGV